MKFFVQVLQQDLDGTVKAFAELVKWMSWIAKEVLELKPASPELSPETTQFFVDDAEVMASLEELRISLQKN